MTDEQATYETPDLHPDLVVVLTPYRTLGKRRRTEYLRRAIAHVLADSEGTEVPLASHQLLAESEVLNAGSYADDAVGLGAQRAMIASAARVRAYIDHGVSAGMSDGIDFARSIGKEVVLESIGKE